MKKLLVIISIVLISSFIAPQKQLINYVSGKPVDGFSVTWPASRVIFEPIVGLSEYLLSFDHYLLQLLSWLFWLGLAAFLYGKRKERHWERGVQWVFFVWLCLLSFVLFSLIFPLPSPRLVTPIEFSRAVDFHSHTYYSHDGVVSPSQSLAFHEKLGFDSFFVTEHGHTDSFGHFPIAKHLSMVFPGLQVQTTEHISLLVLADRPFDGEDFTHRTIREVIRQAHLRGFVVICPHWWKWEMPSLETLFDDGIDGFEIYNAGYRNVTDEERQELIAFCTKRKLVMVGSSDWHGWGRMGNVWTVFATSIGSISPVQLLRERTNTIVLVRGQNEYRGAFRYVFEPFFGAYYYCGTLRLKGFIAWFCWGIALYLLGTARKFVPLRRDCALIFGGIAAAVGMYYFILWLMLRPENQILGKLMSPIFLAVSGGWLYFSKKDW